MNLVLWWFFIPLTLYSNLNDFSFRSSDFGWVFVTTVWNLRAFNVDWNRSSNQLFNVRIDLFRFASKFWKFWRQTWFGLLPYDLSFFTFSWFFYFWSFSRYILMWLVLIESLWLALVVWYWDGLYSLVWWLFRLLVNFDLGLASY